MAHHLSTYWLKIVVKPVRLTDCLLALSVMINALKSKKHCSSAFLIKHDSFLNIACTIKQYNGWIVCPGAAFPIQSLYFSKANYRTKFLCPSH